MPNRKKVGVQPIAGSTFLYGFYTTLDSAESTALGHVDATTNTSSAFLYGVNSPTPARLTKIRDSGRSASSFADVDNVAAARAAGWRLIRPARYRRPTNTALSKVVYVKYSVNGFNINYAWRMPTDTYARIGSDRAALGILDATGGTAAAARDLVWGTNNPKPPKAIKKGADGSILSTFFDPDATLPAGWSSSAAYATE